MTTANDQTACPFCDSALPGVDRELLCVTAYTAAFEDAYPSTPGHVLVIPRRHVGRVLDLTDAEFEDIWRVAREQLRRIEEASPDAFTIGINDGAAAGQTVDHVHLHIIPRHHLDTADSRGGVRWAIPETAAYWNAE
jgi:diadenosine tetraphosphate (Ap4A) HIT family hydrolase